MADEPIDFSHAQIKRLRGLAEGQKITYELVVDTRSGKTSADQLRVAA
jgi:CspA family cold shock protein